MSQPYICKKCGKEMWSLNDVVEHWDNVYCKNCNPDVQQIRSHKIANSEIPEKKIHDENKIHKSGSISYKKGDLIGNLYEIYDVLGEGGFGIVYLVYAYKNPPYAFKTFKDEYLADKEIRERFKKEAMLWINLGKHPNIVQAKFIANFAERLYIAMEYIQPNEKGLITLDDYLKYQPPDLIQSIRWGIQFCHGMEYAYLKGIRVHRDIKPSNILIASDKSLKISDFGLAGALSAFRPISGVKLDNREGSIGLSCQTINGVGFGTPPYMPPEQFTNAASCDERSDIYSFGIVLYQIATGGKLPFYPKIPRDNSIDEQMRFWNDIYKLHCEALVPYVDSPLFTIIKKCLEKKVKKRYQSFNELRKDLEMIHDRFAKEIVKSPENIDLDIEEMVRMGLSYLAMKEWKKAIEYSNIIIKRDLNHKKGWSFKGFALKMLGRLNEAKDCFNKVVQLDPFDKSAWKQRGDILKTLKEFKESLNCYKKIVYLDPTDIGGWVNAGKLLIKLNQNNEASEYFKRAIEIEANKYWEWIEKGDAFIELMGIINKDSKGFKGFQEEALRCYDKAIEIDPKEKWAWVSKANVFEKSSKFKEALNCYDNALERDPTGEWGIWGSKGSLYEKLGDLHKALECYEKALKYDPTDDIAEKAIKDLRSKIS